MTDLTRAADPETRRALELDALAAILPMDRRDRLAETSHRRRRRDAQASGAGRDGRESACARSPPISPISKPGRWRRPARPLPWPAPEALALKFVAHHLWDPARARLIPPTACQPRSRPRCPRAGALRADGPHAPSTVKRRLASWATLHHWRGLDGPFATPALRSAVRLAVRASARPRRRKSQRAVTRDVLDRLLATCHSDRLADCRDGALLLIAFGSGGRRRSEIAGLRVEQLCDEAPVAARPRRSKFPAPALHDDRCFCAPRPPRPTTTRPRPAGRAARRRLARSGSSAPTSPRARSFAPSTNGTDMEDRALTPQAVNLIVKRRCVLAGLDPREFSAHGLRSGYLTEAARRGVSLPEAMQQSQHRSVQQAANYYNDADRRLGKAARLMV